VTAMRNPIPLIAGLVLALAACEPATSTTTPDDTAALERIDSTASPSDPGTTDGAAAGPAAAPKSGPKVRDRDPEEEKKKLALSHQRSAEAQRMLASGRFTEALDHSKQALKIHEQNVAAMLVMGEVYYKQKKFELVQAVTSTALAVDAKIRTPQETSRAHNLKGFAYAAMGDDNLATQAFRMAADADDKNAGAWNNLGTRYMQAGDVATAKSCFTYALELDPRFAKAHVNLGAALRGEGKWQSAEKSLLTALKLRPSYPEAYFNLGVLYLDADPYPGLETVPRLEKAIGFLTKYRDLAIADGPEGPGPSIARSGPTVKPGPAPVSKARADDYIRVAKKGIEREQRRIDREKGRDKPGEAAKPGSVAKPGAAAKPTAAGADDAGSPPPDVGTGKPGGGVQAPGTVKPSKPSTPAPGDAPSTATPTAPAKPGTATPSPPISKPGATPSTPSEPPATKPSAPSTSTPVQPTSKPSAPAPVQPTSKPSAPAPVQPTSKPSAPAPSPPASPPAAKPSAPPSQPTTPPAAPQKPSVQKPGAKSARATTRVPTPSSWPSSRPSAWRCDRPFAPSCGLERHDDVATDHPTAWNTRQCVDTHCPALSSRWAELPTRTHDASSSSLACGRCSSAPSSAHSSGTIGSHA
jgi:tetratricopeptide (TPR) repeat protein